MNTHGTFPTFIGGFRSGSTLLINLLGLHPDIAPWFETKFICEALRWQRVQKYPDRAELEKQLMQPVRPSGYSIDDVVARMASDMQATAARIEGRLKSGKAAHERYPIGHDCISYPLAEAQTALGIWRDEVAADSSSVHHATGQLIVSLGRRQALSWDRRLWINKTPEIPRFGVELRSCLGDCRVVLLIRDGYQVALSSSRLNAGGVERIATWWKGLILESRAANPDPASYLELRYEQLVNEPARLLDELFGFLQLPMLGVDIAEEYRMRMGRNAFKRPAWLRWQKLGWRNRRKFDAIAGDLRQALGYRR